MKPTFQSSISPFDQSLNAPSSIRIDSQPKPKSPLTHGNTFQSKFCTQLAALVSTCSNNVCTQCTQELVLPKKLRCLLAELHPTNFATLKPNSVHPWLGGWCWKTQSNVVGVVWLNHEPLSIFHRPTNRPGTTTTELMRLLSLFSSQPATQQLQQPRSKGFGEEERQTAVAARDGSSIIPVTASC